MKVKINFLVKHNTPPKNEDEREKSCSPSHRIQTLLKMLEVNFSVLTYSFISFTHYLFLQRRPCTLVHFVDACTMWTQDNNEVQSECDERAFRFTRDRFGGSLFSKYVYEKLNWGKHILSNFLLSILCSVDRWLLFPVRRVRKYLLNIRGPWNDIFRVVLKNTRWYDKRKRKTNRDSAEGNKNRNEKRVPFRPKNARRGARLWMPECILRVTAEWTMWKKYRKCFFWKTIVSHKRHAEMEILANL